MSQARRGRPVQAALSTSVEVDTIDSMGDKYKRSSFRASPMEQQRGQPMQIGDRRRPSPGNQAHVTNGRAVVLSVAMIVAQACAQTPVASVAVSIDPSFVRQGTTVAVTYGFTPGDQLGVFESDYRVLVEFLGTSGVVWEDHHMPPVPTSTWGSRDDVVYTRSTLVPINAALGITRVRVSLESAQDGRNLPLDAGDGGNESDRLPRFEILPGGPDSFPITYGDGWYDREAVGLRPPRWTSREATATFANPGQDTTLYIQLEGRPKVFEQPQQVTIDVGEARGSSIWTGSRSTANPR